MREIWYLMAKYLQATLCGTNLPDNEACRCQHPLLTDDDATALE